MDLQNVCGQQRGSILPSQWKQYDFPGFPFEKEWIQDLNIITSWVNSLSLGILSPPAEWIKSCVNFFHSLKCLVGLNPDFILVLFCYCISSWGPLGKN